MPKIRFITDVKVYAQGEVEQEFKAGQVVDATPAIAYRWCRRNKAVDVTDSDAEGTKAAAPQPEAPEKTVSDEPEEYQIPRKLYRRRAPQA